MQRIRRVCRNPQVRVDQLDGYVWQAVCELLQQPKRILAEWSRRLNDCPAAQLQEHREETARIVANYENNLRRLIDAYEAGVIELPDLQTRTEGLRARIERARLVLVEADKRISETVNLRAVVTQLEDFAARVRDGLDHVSWLEKRRIIRALVAKVEIDEDGATIVYRLSPPSSTPDGEEVGGPPGRAPETRVSPRPGPS